MNQIGLIVTSYGLNFIVEVDNIIYTAVTKSKKTDYVVGDIVKVTILNKNQAQIINLQPRTNLVFRTDKNRSKIIASNITQLLIVIAVTPNFNINFLNRCLIFAESQNIAPTIIINKIDLPESADFINNITNLYHHQLNYKIICLSALNNCNELNTKLINQKSLLIGQSGVGKSTITNQIIPNANTLTNHVTKSATSGRHTTTNATLYHIDKYSYLIDCPGLHEFGLYHIKKMDIANYFPECNKLIGKCRFRNCRHINEPDCAIINAYKNGGITETRFNFLQSLLT